MYDTHQAASDVLLTQIPANLDSRLICKVLQTATRFTGQNTNILNLRGDASTLRFLAITQQELLAPGYRQTSLVRSSGMT